MGLIVGCWGSRDWGLEGSSVVVVLLLGDLSSCGARAAYSFGGLLDIGHITSPCGLSLQFCFHPWGVSWVSLGSWDSVHLHLGLDASSCCTLICACID